MDEPTGLLDTNTNNPQSQALEDALKRKREKMAMVRFGPGYDDNADDSDS